MAVASTRNSGVVGRRMVDGWARGGTNAATRVLTDDRRRQLCRAVVLLTDCTRAARAELDTKFDPLLTNTSAILLLTHLALTGPVRPRDARRATGLTTGGVSNLLSRLESAGAIARIGSTDGDDGRAVSIELTAAGREAELAITATVLDNASRSAVILRELHLTLEHLGARPSRRRPSPAMAPARAQVTVALAAVGDELSAVLRSPHTDRSGALVAMAVADAGPCRPRYLAERLGMTTASTSNTLERLERARLIERSAGFAPHDQRAVTVALCPAGRRLVDELATNVDVHLDQLMSTCDDVCAALGVATMS